MVGSTHASAVEEIKVPTLSPGGLRSIRARAAECLLEGVLHTTPQMPTHLWPLAFSCMNRLQFLGYYIRDGTRRAFFQSSSSMH